MSERTDVSPAVLPVLVPQAHGGALSRCGEPGNVASPGRHPSEFRARSRGSLEERVGILDEIADDSEALGRDRIRAMEAMASYGLGAGTDVTVDQSAGAARADRGPHSAAAAEEMAGSILKEMRAIWQT